MALKEKLATYGLIGLVIIALAKPLAQVAGAVGTATGSAIEQGLQNFVSQLTGGLIPAAAGQGGQPPAMTGGGSMMQTMMPAAGMGENPAQALVGGIGTVAGMMAIKAGAADPLLKGLTDPAATGSGKSIIDYLMGRAAPIGADVPPVNVAKAELALENAFGTNIFQKIPTIGDQFLMFLKTGGMSISDFASSFKFPSGMTLNEILGSGGAGKGGSIGADKAIIDFGGGSNIVKFPSFEAFGEVQMTPAMMMVANLNIDKKIDTPYGTISYGSAAGSAGAGKGGILPAQNLTQVLQENPKLTASQAADLLFRMMGSPAPSGFDFGSNTGAGLISKFTVGDKTMLPRAYDSMINPVLAAYEAYRAQYGV